MSTSIVELKAACDAQLARIKKLIEESEQRTKESRELLEWHVTNIPYPRLSPQIFQPSYSGDQPSYSGDQPLHLCDRKLDQPYSDWSTNAPIQIPILSKFLQLQCVFEDWHGKKDSSDCCLQLQMCRLKPNKTIVLLNLLHRQLETFMCQGCGESRTKLVIFFHACEQYRLQYHTIVHSVLDNLILKDLRLLVFAYYDQPIFVFKDNVAQYIK